MSNYHNYEKMGGNGTPRDSEVVNISFKAKEERIKNQFPQLPGYIINKLIWKGSI